MLSLCSLVISVLSEKYTTLCSNKSNKKGRKKNIDNSSNVVLSDKDRLRATTVISTVLKNKLQLCEECLGKKCLTSTIFTFVLILQ